ncbi:hypothetical protein MSAN_00595000 [Mycena sanguinolenta]|uniref:Uncharacterized protein n=1 Tax=Mycena sanguinolenta TaxID=230812 RepID=A0A8H6ZA83_9AGAR|nr:hypothetical protein MSAN_00595000 [Mycena sanguinolenta]
MKDHRYPIFPPELFAAIIDKLADDLESLRSCALVSLTFYSLARVSSRLQVGPLVDQAHSIVQLCELLESSPPFAEGVESLRLCCEWKEPNPCSWITEAESDLGRCLSLLVSLSRLCITVGGGYYPSLPWPRVSITNRDLIRVILPTLTCLELHNIREFPLPLLSRCLSLRSLTLANVLLGDDSERALIAADMDPRAQLQPLSLVKVPAFVLARFVLWITSTEYPLDISCLCSLECILPDALSYLWLQRLSNASAQNLQCLYIKDCCFCMSSRSLHV